MVEKIYNLVEILDRDVVKNGDGVTPFQFKLSYSDGKTVDLKDKRVYVSFASTTTYLFKKKAEVDSKGTISITLNDADPIIEGNTEIEISVESSNGKSQKFPSQDGEHSAFVYISKSIESLNSRVISTYTLKQFSDKIDILMDDLDKKYDDHLDNLKKDVGDYIDNSVEDKVDEIKAVAKESTDASIKASKDSIAASLTAENNVKATSTKAVADINSTATKATKNITDTSNTAVATVDAKAKEVTDAIKDNQVVKITETANWQKVKLSNDDGTSLGVPPAIKDWLLITDSGNYAINTDNVPENRPPSGTYFSLTVLIRDSRSRVLLAYDIEKTNSFIRTMVGGKWRTWEQFGIDKEAKNYQNNKITADNGQFYYNLTDNKSDILASVISESGFKTGYAHFTVLNGLGNNRSFRFTSYYYPTNGYIHAVDTAGQSHIRVCNGGTWGEWKSLADTSVTQNFKITNDDGSTIAITNYDLLNTTDVANFDGYVTGAGNSPASSSSGYFKRKYRSGYIEVTFSPHSSKELYRNSYNGVAKTWVGWEKIISQSDTSTYQKQKITNDDGSTITITNYDLLNTTDIANFDGYSNTAINMPAGVHKAGYIKRKNREGFIEVTYSPHNLNTVYRNSYNPETKVWTGWEKLVTASELAALESKLNASKPVTLWSGSANGVSSTPYALSRAINTSRKIRVTYDFSGASGKTAVTDLSNTKTLTIHDLNLTDGDANGGGLYEFQLDFTALNKFTIKADTVKDLNGAGKIDQKNMTVRKVEEVD